MKRIVTDCEMATYSISNGMTAGYDNGKLVAHGTLDIVLLNNQSNNNFAVGDIISHPMGLSYGKFIGTTVIDGTTVIVLDAGIDYDGIARSRLFGGDTFTPPNKFASLTIDPSPFPVCFLAGTAIATPTGPRPIEDLAIGDPVLTADGRAAPVRWIGVQTVVRVFADPLRGLPIRIAAGALGDGLPQRDLFVSPDHALFLGGVLVQAGALVNGTTITRVTDMPERFTYFHVELDDHALILAEGVPAETFVDNVTRRRFDNWAEYAALYGDTGASITEMDVPRIKSARQLPAALRTLIGQAAAGSQAA